MNTHTDIQRRTYVSRPLLHNIILFTRALRRIHTLFTNFLDKIIYPRNSTIRK